MPFLCTCLRILTLAFADLFWIFGSVQVQSQKIFKNIQTTAINVYASMDSVLLHLDRHVIIINNS